MRLRVSVGSNKDDLQTAWVNVEDKPTEIDTKYWVGRVLVRVKDFDGFTPDGSPPATESEYFEGRNRRFHIQAEGRFKKGYNGDQVWFGTQFDHMIANFPETLFNAGMRIAKYIDPAVFYDKTSHTPYIMSPYLACVNTLSAWPAPHRSGDAVLALENGNAINDSDEEGDEANEVPREEVQHSKHAGPPRPVRYWSFQGFREDETTNTLQRKPTRESLIQEESMAEDQGNREGSIRTQSTRYEPDRLVTSENPKHRLALTRLGSHGRETTIARSSFAAMGGQHLDTFPEDLSDEDDLDDDNDSFHTAAEYIFENEVQPDGTVVPVKKKKSGLSVKKVRKSLHIPSAKTMQKNMRGLSIKRKDKTDKRTDSFGLDSEKTEDSRNSGEAPPTRKSIDLMRPFRFGHHEKDHSVSSTTRQSVQIDREKNARSPQLPKSRSSMSDERDFSTRPTAVIPIARPTESRSTQPPNTTGAVRAATFPVVSGPADGLQPPISSTLGLSRPSTTHHDGEGKGLRAIPTGRTDSSLTTITSEPPIGAAQSLHSVESGARQPTLSNTLRTTDSDWSSAAAGQASARDAPLPSSERASSPNKVHNSGEVEDDGISHKLDAELGPWRFSNPSIEPIEDTAFIFGDTSHTVKDRRKHFAKSEERRKEFEFDPDIVYCMSFFLPYMNFNTFDLKLGPLGANLHKYVDDQPVRYMARSAERLEEVFFMVEFSLE